MNKTIKTIIQQNKSYCLTYGIFCEYANIAGFCVFSICRKHHEQEKQTHKLELRRKEMNYNNMFNTAQQGWQCPVCGRINAPWMPQCPCNGKMPTQTWTTGTELKKENEDDK